ncbi:MAG: PD-(D/E)XK nuclease family protein [Magnetococcales bacterium]|nr:PD-(D/E)XK nuclease family protein [Magnetococcales bacterium]
MDILTVRASMLPSYADCPRRAVAKQWRRLVENRGFVLRRMQPSAGAAVGTAVHAAAAKMLKEKIETGSTGSAKDGLDAAMEVFREEIKEGAVWDATTPNAQTAETQIGRLSATYHEHVAGELDPIAVEQEWECLLGDGFLLSGHCDVLTREGFIRDLKTGALSRPHHAQLGAYALLARSQRPAIEIRGVVVDFIRRTPKTKPQDAPVSEEYDLNVAENTAFETIQRIKHDLTAFLDNSNPWAFMANPLSMMCRSAYCPAHGTTFCHLGREN